MPAMTFTVVFVGLYVGHHIGDQWAQRDSQALHKHLPGWAGRRACAAHVIGLTVTKALTLGLTVAVTGVALPWSWTLAAFGIDVASHYWADRRTTLARFAQALGKGPYYRLGQPRVGHDDLVTVGTGAYHLDQSWHLTFVWAAALIITAGA